MPPDGGGRQVCSVEKGREAVEAEVEKGRAAKAAVEVVQGKSREVVAEREEAGMAATAAAAAE